MSYTVVWFKRDLRVHDHAPLMHAAARGPVLCLYVIEPGLWAQPDAAPQHYAFVQECLRDLDGALRAGGVALQVAVGEVPAVLAALHARQPFDALHAHEETGNGFTYARDQAVAQWCREAGVHWQEWPQHGVVRRLRSRDAWQARWQAQMGGECLPAPAPGQLHGPALPWAPEPWPDAVALGLRGADTPLRQRGGRSAGWLVLTAFLHERSAQYRGGISSPLTAPTACSRLSPYLALGCLGMREVVQATRTRLRQLNGPEAQWQRRGLEAFVSRLHWHCHFIQRLESESALEYCNLHRGYDGLRESEWNADHFDALVAGRTGWPLVDACVAMLRDTGWINFRMRAMLVSVAAYPLWLHWRPVGEWLARQFLDYEPGIHWSQMQMQSGTTGINTTRVYNPIKQARDQDPQGHFVRRWLPALRRVPDAWLYEPWRMPPDLQARCGVRVGHEIAAPIVDLEAATRLAKARVHALRARSDVRDARAAIVDRHGSRSHHSDYLREAAATPRRRRQPPEHPQQITLDF